VTREEADVRRIRHLILSYSLSYPAISFSLYSPPKNPMRISATKTYRDAIFLHFGARIGEKMQHVTHSYFVPSSINGSFCFSVSEFSTSFLFFICFVFSDSHANSEAAQCTNGSVDFDVFFPKNDLLPEDLKEVTRRYQMWMKWKKEAMR
jgi:hypothetical protein